MNRISSVMLGFTMSLLSRIHWIHSRRVTLLTNHKCRADLIQQEIFRIRHKSWILTISSPHTNLSVKLTSWIPNDNASVDINIKRHRFEIHFANSSIEIQWKSQIMDVKFRAPYSGSYTSSSTLDFTLIKSQLCNTHLHHLSNGTVV